MIQPNVNAGHIVTPVPTGPPGVDMSLAALVARARKHEQATIAETVLRRLRVTRLLSWGPEGGGKTTGATACTRKLGKCAVVAVDQDIKPVPGCDVYLMPQPQTRHDIPLLSRAHLDAMATIRKGFGTSAECHIVALDTITTLHNWLYSFSVENDPSGMMGLDQSSVGYMLEMGKIAKVCVAWASSCWRMGQVAAQLSTHDGPLLFAVTEHAREVTRGETHPQYSKDGKPVVDLAFSQWAPRIARQAGHSIGQECDLKLAYSIDGKPDEARSLLCDTSGAHTKGRFTPPEWDIFRDCMKGKAQDRLADALTAIYVRRKQVWLSQYGG